MPYYIEACFLRKPYFVTSLASTYAHVLNCEMFENQDAVHMHTHAHTRHNNRYKHIHTVVVIITLCFVFAQRSLHGASISRKMAF